MPLPIVPAELADISQKILDGKRISPEEGLYLFEKSGLALLAYLADERRKMAVGDAVFYNRNVHIEPTNICVYDCKFCSYSHHQSAEQWDFTIQEMLDKVSSLGQEITEVHIVGAVHPARDVHYYADLVRKVKDIRPDVHVKAFTAIEIEYMCNKASMSFRDGLALLQSAGLDSLPGGGAEIFDPVVREQICGRKSDAQTWLDIHQTAHELGLPTNATILYGHIETYGHRISHLEKLRQLQDRTRGFNAFIPLKFKSGNNEMSYLGEVSVIEDMRNYAVSRIYLDNIPHLKAYWPMMGKEMAALSLAFGVDDLDGTINDSTKIYSLAGAEDKNPAITTNQLCELISKSGRTPVERDSLYHPISR